MNSENFHNYHFAFIILKITVIIFFVMNMFTHADTIVSN